MKPCRPSAAFLAQCCPRQRCGNLERIKQASSSETSVAAGSTRLTRRPLARIGRIPAGFGPSDAPGRFGFLHNAGYLSISEEPGGKAALDAQERRA